MTAALACGGALLVGAVVRRARRHASFAIGAAFSRIVVFASASDKIPADAKWVLIDQIRGSLGFYNAMLCDRRFRLVYRQEQNNQAIFGRL